VAYSDGVTEARDEEGGFFGDERLRRLLAGSHGRSAEEIGSRIVQAVSDFCGQARPSDDLSIAVLRRRPVARSLVPPDSTPASTVG
jgi:sigma-B regulation protein RsbU (phosphoserine phosphatase)